MNTVKNNILKAVEKSLYSSFLSDQKLSIKIFKSDKNRNINFKKNLNDITFDYSRHHVSLKTLENAKRLAEVKKLNNWINSIFSEEIVNKSEWRAALHPALRLNSEDYFSKEITNTVIKQKNKMFDFAEKVRNGKIKSPQGVKYETVLSIGIGGSDLGPKMTVNALKYFSNGPRIIFVSNVDPSELKFKLDSLNPESTLVIVSSKSFSTSETMLNSKATLNWLTKKVGQNNALKQRIAITSNIKNALKEGFEKDQIFLFDEWVGGRTSIWSSIGLPLVISIGSKEFENFLMGARQVDIHVKKQPIESIPCTMALLSFIQRNYFRTSSQAIIPYDSNLEFFPSYLQQLEMESNGKNIKNDGEFVTEPTSPVIWGGIGTDAQHSFFQMLHQGFEKIPIDILLSRRPVFQATEDELIRHRVLAANALAQCESLSEGSLNKDKNLNFFGGRSVSLLSYNKLDPFTLGSILALYEHKVMFLAALWGINPFDQFGVELGKKYAKSILNKNEKNKGISSKTLDDLLKEI